ncbi:hypothetical protein [Exiguobacterium sp. s95]|uniref:hypothetical protein n=1 Tax=Exiguobacterium sp. s95 TaxID=2751211 RepID=UPI001BE631E1|nr:hypothetical protein [Exiguobacterium sp. s95]
MKTFLFYLMTAALVVIILAKFMVPLLGFFEADEPKPQTDRTSLRLTEAQLKQFDREDRIGVSYEMAGLSLKTLAVKRMDATRQTPLLLVNVQKEKVLQVGGEANRLLAITVKIKNQSADSIEIAPKLGEYETDGRIVTIADQFNALNGTYQSGEERIGIVFIPTTETKIRPGRLNLFYTTASGDKQLRIALNEGAD